MSLYLEDLERLKDALMDEAKGSPLIIMYIKDRSNYYVSAIERDNMARCILHLTKEVNFSHRVFYRAISLLDAFLSTVKTRLEYANCTAATCFYIAAKAEQVKESDNCLQQMLVSKFRLNFTCEDIQKMECIIKDKLESHVYRPTVDQFINYFHSLALSSNLFRLPNDVSIGSHLSRMYKSAQDIVCSHELMDYKPSILALAVLGCDLKLLKCDWLSTILSLQTVAQIRCGLLSVCYEALAADYPRLAAQYQLTPPVQARLRTTAVRNRSKTTPTLVPLDKRQANNKENIVDTNRTRKIYPLNKRHLKSLSVNNVCMAIV